MSEQRIGPEAAAALAAGAYGALLVCVLGVVTLWNDAPVVAARDVGIVPVMLAGLAAVAAFFFVLLRAVRPARPAYSAAIVVALAAALTQLAALWLLALVFGADAAEATAAAADDVMGWSSASFLLLAAACAWGGIAVRRTDASRPRWPWENESP